MKMSRILMVFIIGIISLNLIFADGITKKTFLIKGELEITPQLTTACSGGGTWNNGGVFIIDSENMNGALSSKENDDTLYFSAAASSCDLVIYNTNDIEVYRRSNLNADAIKQGLKNGIPVTLPITSTNPTFNFKVKIYHLSTNSNILETIVTVPNPNAVDTQIEATSSDRLIPQSGIECNSSNLNSVAVVYGGLSVCSAQQEDYVGAPVQYNWAGITSGTETTTSYISTFASLFQKFSFDDFYITANYHGSGTQRIILSPAILYKINNTELELNNLIPKITSIYSNITDGQVLYDDIISYNNFNSELKQRLGLLTTDNVTTINPISNKYYILRASGDTYYIPLYSPSSFSVWAERNLTTTASFDPTWERINYSGYTSSYPPTQNGQLYSDFIYNTYPDRKYISTIKYRPVDITLNSGGNKVDYNITVLVCYGVYMTDEFIGDSIYNGRISGCAVLPPQNLRGETINDNLSNPFVSKTDSLGNIIKKIHVKIPTGYTAIALKFQPSAGGGVEKTSIAGILKEPPYNPITNLSESSITCHYATSNTVVGGVIVSSVYNYTVNAHLEIIGGATTNNDKYYNWCSRAGVSNTSNPIELFSCNPTDIWKKSIDITKTFQSNTPESLITMVTTVMDRKTHQRFAKAIQISCTPE